MSEIVTHVAPAINISFVLALVNPERTTRKLMDAATMTIIRCVVEFNVLMMKTGTRRRVTMIKAIKKRPMRFRVNPA